MLRFPIHNFQMTDEPGPGEGEGKANKRGQGQKGKPKGSYTKWADKDLQELADMILENPGYNYNYIPMHLLLLNMFKCR